MSITPPENGTPATTPVPATTPLYDETIAAPTYDDLRAPGHDAVDDGTSGGAAGDAKDRAKQTTGAAEDAAGDVKDTAKDAGAKVASTGKEQASKVAKDAMGQARELYGQATTQLSSQAGTQQEKAASTLHTFADDLGGMGQHGTGGLASELVQNLETRARGVADWLEQRDPDEVLAEVRRFAARRPGLFIGLAAVTGIVAARLTKALVAEAKDVAEAKSDHGPSAGTEHARSAFADPSVADPSVADPSVGDPYAAAAGDVR